MAETKAPMAPLSDAFRQRMTEEQESRGYTDAGLAARASEYYPVAANTIWQIKKRGRRVDIDEGEAIARALGYADVPALVRSEYYDFHAPFWTLFGELARLTQRSTDDSHPLNVIQDAGAAFTRDRSPEDWRAILNVRIQADRLGHPKVMVRELQRAVTMAKGHVNEVLDEFAADLDRTAQSLVDAEGEDQ